MIAMNEITNGEDVNFNFTNQQFLNQPERKHHHHDSKLIKFYKTTRENRPLVLVVDLILCNIIRFFLLSESAFSIFYLINLTSSLVYLIVLVPLLAIIADDLYVSIKRKGKEYYW